MRREKKPTDTSESARKLSAAIGVPVNQQGLPDLYRHVPSRFVPIAEAQEAGASMYYDGSACRCGHTAARWVTNTNRCADCERLKKGLPTIYPSSRAQTFYAEPRRKPKDAAAPVMVQAPAAKPVEPDANDKKFLTALAESRNFAQAAERAGTTVALVQSRISCNQTFKAAVFDLTERLQIPHPVQVSGKRELTPEEHETFCRTWVDTGSTSKARAAIGISASQMHDELERSAAFKEMFDTAAPKAALALDDIAVDLSLSGNDKLLGKTLPAKLREQYTERIDLRIRNEVLKPEEIDRRFRQLIKELLLLSPNEMTRIAQEAERQAKLEQAEVIDAQYNPVESTAVQTPQQSGEARSAEAIGRAIGIDETDGRARSDDSSNDDLI